MDVVHKISVDFGKEQIPQRISIMQNDSARKIEVSLYENGAVWNVPDGTSAYLAFRRPDGKNLKITRLSDGSPVVLFSDNVATISIPIEVTAMHGSVPIVVVFVNGSGSQIATFPIALSVLESPAAEGDPASQLTPKEFDQLLVEITKTNARINELVASHGSDGAEEYSIDIYGDGNAYITIRSNGTTAVCTVSDNAIFGMGAVRKYQLPERFAPPIAYYEYDGDVELCISDSYDGYTEVALKNKNQTEAKTDGIWFQFVYALAAVYTPKELLDVRVGADGTTYETAGEAVREQMKSASTGSGGGSANAGAVLYTKQSLTPEQQAQARANIGAAALGEGGGGSGEPGTDGFSPIANVTQTASGAVISITDKNGTTTATIVNGKDGVDGRPGKDGVDGKDGAKGDKGDPGEKGEKGDTGAPGADGAKGEKGEKGDTGAPGADGAKGEKGDKGDTGAPGSNGADGKDGSPGKDGVSATHSWNGTTLTITSASGTSSADLKGAPGKDGNPGKDGSAGKTAYQYAQDGGYTGTETEFAEKLANEYSLNPLYGKKVSFLGDSICAGSSENSSYGEIIANRNGMVYENVARAGSTITAETYSSSGVAKGWISRMVANMSADADYAIVEGGINDAWQWSDHKNIEIGAITEGYNATLDDTTYYGAFESMLKQLVTKFQGKKIGYIAVPKTMGLYDSNRNAPNFYHIALECCAKWGVPVCDLNTIIPPTEYLKTLGTTYTADGTHPTYEGYIKYYCDPIEAWMKTLTTGASVGSGSSLSSNDFVKKADVQIKKAQLTLEDGSTVLIDVVVASDGTTINTYLNLIPTSIAEDGSIYNGVGYKYNTRLSSSGAEKSDTSGTTTTGFIPAVGGDVVYLGGVKPWYVSVKNNNYLCAYDSNFTFVGAVYNSVDGFSYTKNIAAAHELGDTCKITLASGMNIAYIRASWPSNTGDVGADLIVTVNQEIT